jgi:hypothetical protein
MTKHKAYTIVNKKYVALYSIRKTAKEAKIAFLEDEELYSWDLYFADGWRVRRITITFEENKK